MRLKTNHLLFKIIAPTNGITISQHVHKPTQTTKKSLIIWFSQSWIPEREKLRLCQKFRLIKKFRYFLFCS